VVYKELGAGPYPLTVIGALGDPDIFMNCLETQWTEKMGIYLAKFTLQIQQHLYNNSVV
jgi:hypothetical protein